MKVLPVPWIDLHYRDRVFLSPIAGLGVNLIAVPEARFGVAVLPNLGRSASSSNRLTGFGDIGAGADLKVFGPLHLFGPIAALAAVRRQLGAGNGTLVDAGLTGVVPLLPRVTLFATGALTWANGRYTQSYFGVDPNQSAAASSYGLTLQPYAAGAGLRDATLALLARIRLDQHWSVQPVLRTEFLLGDAANSPLVERRFQLTFGGFLAYRL
jgi:outer membrane scaffolding protein for murein synthesis (MipA/OmpV family)